MRGLTLFITDLRKCRGKEDEIKRINKELANIRSKFSGNKPLEGYDKKKYVCKLLFMFLLGYKCDLGHKEAVNILLSNAYSQKQIGYLFISVIKGNHDLMPLVINALKNDLLSNNNMFQNLALQFVANNANVLMSKSLGNEVTDALISKDTEDFVKQTAALTLLQLLRIKPDIVSSEHTAKRIINLLSHHDLGVVTASVTLVEFIANNFPSQQEFCVEETVCRLSRITAASWLDFKDYTYYQVAAPWLTVKLLRLLQNFKPSTNISINGRLKESLELILNKGQEPLRSKKIEHSNAKYAVVFEGISTIIQMNVDSYLLTRAIDILGNALKQKEPNLRFMALDMMIQLLNRESSKGNLKSHWEAILMVAKNDTDLTVKKCALNLLYNICDKINVQKIIEQMLYFLETEEDTNKEEIVLKSAALAEQFSTDFEWYTDTIFNIMKICPDYLHNNIWYSLVKVIVDQDSVHEYAAKASFNALKEKSCPDCIVKVAAYILGEFGYLIEKYSETNHLEQFNILKEKYFICSFSTQALLLTTFMKLLNLHPYLKEEVQSILRHRRSRLSENEEVQKRAVEYLMLSQVASNSLSATIFQGMPSCKRKESAVLDALVETKSQTFDGSCSKITEGKSAPPFRSVCCLTNIDMYRENQNNCLKRSMSQFNLRTTAISSNQNFLIDLCSETSVSSLTSNIGTLSTPMSPLKFVAPRYSASSQCNNESSSLPAPVISFNYKPIIPQFRNISILSAAPAASASVLRMPPSNSASHMPRILPASSNEKYIYHMLFNEAGYLFEDQMIEISIKGEFHKNYGRFHLVYKNKSCQALSDFTIQGNFTNTQNKCSIWFKPSCTVLESFQSIVQDIHLECLTEFIARPSMVLEFRHAGVKREIKLTLPLTMNKFIESADMSPELFAQRWKSLRHEIVKVFVAKSPMIPTVTRLKLKGFGVALIEKVELNTDNIFCAGVFYRRMQKIGILIRLERYPEANKYRLVVRSNQQSISKNISNLLFELL